MLEILKVTLTRDQPGWNGAAALLYFISKLMVLEHNVCNSLKRRDAQTLDNMVGYSRVKQT